MSTSFSPSDQLRGIDIPDSYLKSMPKTNLLCHLDGSMRLDTFMELASDAGYDLLSSQEEAYNHYFPCDENCQEHFSNFFDETVPLMQTAEVLQRVAYETAYDAAEQNCLYLEVRFCPLRHQENNLGLDALVEAVCAGLQEASEKTGIKCRVIITGLRTIDPASSLELAELAVRWRGRGVVAFDLAGTEKDNPAKRHQKAFYHLMNNNMNCTIHAGEGFGPESIHDALHRCGANRIGHGTRLHEDLDLLAWVNDNRIPLEMSVSSNVLTGVVATAGQHPLRHYLDIGLRVSLNVDNSLFARSSILSELRLVVDTFDFSLLETETLLLNGFKSAFLPQKEKGAMTAKALDKMRELRTEFDQKGQK
jgi:adenosine deaminase